jgi:hypothetical protein
MMDYTRIASCKSQWHFNSSFRRIADHTSRLRLGLSGRDASMTARSIFVRLRERSRQFPSANGGNAMMLFGLLLVPLLGVTGAAVDYGRASAARTRMQAALDFTALAVAKEAKSLSADEITQKAKACFNTMFQYKDMSRVTVTAKYTSTGVSNLQLTAKGSLKNEFMGLFGDDEVDIGTVSTAS